MAMGRVVNERGGDMLEMWLYDREGHKMIFAYVETVEEGRAMWKSIAGGVGKNLAGFRIRGQWQPVSKSALTMYKGNYVTDEC